jgi:uncharacterized protein (DUF488 family)
MQIFTVGHSTHTAEEFARILQHHGIQQLVDIRTHPGSRKFPHFNSDAMAAWLPESGINYVHMKALGGRRKPRPDSRNTAWENEGFRGYADYMQTVEFGAALRELVESAANKRTVMMCAEAVPWRCHRNLVSDALVLLHGIEVLHITGTSAARAHRPAAFAALENGELYYPGEQQELF